MHKGVAPIASIDRRLPEHGRIRFGEKGPIVDERFDAKVEFTESCWLWLGYCSNGYGQVGRGGQLHKAHRYAYESLVGPIPLGLELDHLCRVRNCVNPAHLEPVTRRENILRGLSRAALFAARTTCSVGHEFDAIHRRGDDMSRRTCRTCNNAYLREWRAKRRG